MRETSRSTRIRLVSPFIDGAVDHDREAKMTKNGRTSAALVALVLLAAGCGGGTSGSGEVLVGLVTKTDTNPFFVKMKEGAQQAAGTTGAKLQSFAGKQDGDNQTQVDAIENLIGAGAKGLLITPNDSKGIVPSV